METINRKLAPKHHATTHFEINEAQTHQLQSGVNVCAIVDGNHDVLKIDFVYNGGVRNEPQRGVSKAAITLLPEGTSRMKAEEIAEKLDFYGAYLQTNHTRDESVLSLYCLPKHLASCLSIVKEVLLEAQYPEIELNTYKQNGIQSLTVNEQKTTFLARRRFNELMWGKDKPYGSAVNQNDIENISRETLLSFSRNVYACLPRHIFVGGNVSHETLALLDALFDKSFGKANVLQPVSIEPRLFANEKTYVEKAGANQVSIRIGKQTIGRTHADFRELSVVNMILGGYFGSRLMSNIREEKGLTYGIYSSIETQFDGASFCISVELNKENVDLGLAEIRKELARLRTQPIADDELTVVRNYFIGSFLRGFDGVFSLMSFAKNVVDYNLGYQYYYDFINVINNVDAARVMQLAERYLHEDSMAVVISGDYT
jgi:zinc protease